MLRRNVATGAALCLLAGVAVLLLLQATLVSPHNNGPDDGLLLQKNRQLVAKDYELRDGQLIAARIDLRTRRLQRSWLSVVFDGPAPREQEVVAQLKSGDHVVIDRLRTDAAFDPVIVDGAGAVVGYFQYRVPEDDNWTTHRVTYVLYLVAQSGLLRREGEAMCRKVGSEGRPYVRASNARWDSETRELQFTLRSTCYHVRLFGSGSRDTLNMLTGEFGFDLSLKESPLVETTKRLTVSFDTRGDTFVWDVPKGNSGSRRNFLKCVEEAKADSSFRICGDPTPRQVFWQLGMERVSYELCGNGWDLSGKTYFVRACPDTGSATTSRWTTFSIANQDAHAGVEALLECSCSTLRVERMSFDPRLRNLSFNLETDAKVIKFAGGEFQVPTITSRSQDGKVTMQIPTFTIHFNEHWQITKMTAVGGDARSAESATALSPQKEKGTPNLNEKE